MRHHKRYQHIRHLACTGTLGLLLAACGSDGTTPAQSPTTTSVSGVAATGAPITSGNIVLHCQNNWNEGTTTDNDGKWSMIVPSANLPCAVKASNSGGSEIYYSFTVGTGSAIVTNVTPLTSLALARANGATVDDTWFNALNDGGRLALSTGLSAAITALGTALNTQSYTLPANFNPFAASFTATTGNDYDDLLEELKAAISAAATDFTALLANFAAGTGLPASVAVPPSSGSATASGTLTTGNILSPNLSPNTDGFSVAVDYESITYTFLADDIVNNISYNHDLSIETDLNGNISNLTYRDGRLLGNKSLVCGSDYGKPCPGVSITPTLASKSVSIAFTNASMTLYNVGTMTTETASFNGTLTGALPSTYVFSTRDLPRSTDGTLNINGSDEAVLSASVGISSAPIPNGVYTVSSTEIRSQSGKLTFTRNTTTPTTGSPTTTDSLTYLKAGGVGANDLYQCDNCVTAMTVTESGGFTSIKFQDVVMKSFGTGADITLNNTLSIGSTSGSLTAGADSLTFNDSSVYSEGATVTYRFTTPTNTSVVTIDLKQGTSTAAMISVQHGGKLYTCYEQAQPILGAPACGSGITMSVDRRTLTLTGISLNSGKFGGNLPLSISGALTSQGI